MKNLLLLSILLCLCLFCFAQNKAHKITHHEYGLTVGANIPYYHNGDREFAGSKHAYVGIQAGGYYLLQITKSLAIRAEGLYICGGADNPKEINTFKDHYLEVPFNLVLGSGPLTFEAGIYYARLISAASRNEFATGFSWPVKKWDYYNKNDYGITTGITYNFHNLYGKLTYQYGLANVRNVYYNDPKLKGSKTAAFGIKVYVPIN